MRLAWRVIGASKRKVRPAEGLERKTLLVGEPGTVPSAASPSMARMLAGRAGGALADEADVVPVKLLVPVRTSVPLVPTMLPV